MDTPFDTVRDLTSSIIQGAQRLTGEELEEAIEIIRKADVAIWDVVDAAEDTTLVR